jgi:hypothetical protein
MKRRTLLTASLPVAAGVIATGALSGEILDPASDDPHAEWYQEWSALIEEHERDPGMWDIGDHRQVRRMKLERKICETPATTLEGVKAQVALAASEDFGMVMSGSNDIECTLLRTMVRSMQALT